MAAPLTFTGVVGLKRTLEAPATQTLNGVEYTFRGWGRKRAHVLDLRTPRVAQTFVARYELTLQLESYHEEENRE